MRTLQEWIHLLEEGEGVRWLRGLLAVFVLIGLATLYNHRCFRHFSNPEAMDAAQLARNLAAGKGYTTDFVRPAALYLLRRETGRSFLDEPHPDVANAPLYPWLLSGWMRIAGFDYAIGDAEGFEAYEPELRIAWFNQFLFILTLLSTWLLARRLFDPLVAWVAAGLLAGTDLLWRYSISGLSTCLAMLLVTVLAHLLVSLERSGDDEKPPNWRWLGLALALGGVAGALGLTRYSCAWLLLPLVGCVSVWLGARGFAAGVAVLTGFLIVMTPWCARNFGLTGLAFGTAGFAVHQETTRFPGDVVERLMNPEDGNTQWDIRQVGLGEYGAKLQEKLPEELRLALPALGGNWIAMFFLVGLFLPFHSRTRGRLRWFVLICLLFLVVAQSLGRTHWGGLAPRVNADDLLVVLAPPVFVFGAGLFVVMLGQLDVLPVLARRVGAPAFVVLLCLPLGFRLYAGERSRLAYPPYYPPIVQEWSGWLEPTELLMTDVPWATAWYGDRRSVWLPAEFGPGFLQINREKPVAAVYLTALTMDRPLVTGLMRGRESALGRFVAEAVVNEEIPPGFPLPHAFAEGFPYQLFLADRPRWRRSDAASAVKGDAAAGGRGASETGSLPVD